MIRKPGFYKHQLSLIHHQHFGGIAQSAAREVLNWIDQFQIQPDLLIDLGCGSGILAKMVSQQDIAVLGVDFSEEMLNLARQEAPTAQFVRASLFEYYLPKAKWVDIFGLPLN